MSLSRSLGLNLSHVSCVFLPYPLILLCDNISATYLGANLVLHIRRKHVELCYHFIHERVMCTITTQYTPSKDQLVDVIPRLFLYLASPIFGAS